MSAQSALLSNYEVLSLLREHDARQSVNARAALVKQEDVDDKNAPLNSVTSISQNVRTVQFEVKLL